MSLFEMSSVVPPGAHIHERRASSPKDSARVGKRSSRTNLKQRHSRVSLREPSAPSRSKQSSSLPAEAKRSAKIEASPSMQSPARIRGVRGNVPNTQGGAAAAAATALFGKSQSNLAAPPKITTNMTPLKKHSVNNVGQESRGLYNMLRPPPSPANYQHQQHQHQHPHYQVQQQMNLSQMHQQPMAAAAAAAAAASNTATPQNNQYLRSSPSTIFAGDKSAGSIIMPSPTPASRMHSSSELVSAASASSPAKGVFRQTQSKASQPPRIQPREPQPRRRKPAKIIPEMSSAMSQFQVELRPQRPTKPENEWNQNVLQSVNSQSEPQRRLQHQPPQPPPSAQGLRQPRPQPQPQPPSHSQPPQQHPYQQLISPYGIQQPPYGPPIAPIPAFGIPPPSGADMSSGQLFPPDAIPGQPNMVPPQGPAVPAAPPAYTYTPPQWSTPPINLYATQVTPPPSQASRTSISPDFRADSPLSDDTTWNIVNPAQFEKRQSPPRKERVRPFKDIPPPRTVITDDLDLGVPEPTPLSASADPPPPPPTMDFGIEWGDLGVDESWDPFLGVLQEETSF